MLMDEPFSNLDVLLTDQIKWYLTKHLDKNKNSFIFVTHHTNDALALADYVLAMRNGKIEQFGTTYELFEQPNSPYIAALFSDCSFLKFNKLETMGVKGLSKISAELGNSFLVGIRTTSIEVTRKGKATCKGRIIRTEYEGSRLKLFVRLENNVQLKAYTSDLSFEKGEYVKLTFTKNDLLYFPNHKSL
jgi:iron(III) transport system ATP-binding protein